MGRKIKGRSTTEEVAGEPDVTNSQFMLPAHVQGGGVMSVHEPYVVVLNKNNRLYGSIFLLVY
jgi:hypothetical protein